jgi:hypothetical protein
MSKPATLRREIAVVLIVKLALILLLKWLFFNHPAAPGSSGTAAALLSPDSNPSLTSRSSVHE